MSKADPKMTALAPAIATRRRHRLSLRTFDSLEDRNYRWFFAAMLATFSSMSMQMFVAGWLVFEMTGSYRALGAMSMTNGTANVVMSLVGGVLADRVRSKKLLVQVAQAASATTALALGLLILAGALQVAHVFIAGAMLAGCYSLSMPARQSLTPEVVGMERLMNAQGLYMTGQSVGRLFMPGVAGWVVGAFGPGEGIGGAEYVYFLIAAFSVLSLILLVPVRVLFKRPTNANRGRPLGDLVDGFRYAVREPTMRALLSYNTYVALFAMTITILLPGFGKDVLDIGVDALGLLVSVDGIGALAGGLVIASLPNRRRATMWLLMLAFLGCALVAFASNSVYWLALPLIALVGVGQGAHLSLSTVLVQAYADDRYRGRVLAIYNMEYGLMAYGVFLISMLADVAGPQAAVAVCGIALLVPTVPMLLFSERFRKLE